MHDNDECRPAHWLQPNFRTSAPVHCLFFDTETVPRSEATAGGAEAHVFRIGVVSYFRLRGGKVTGYNRLNLTDPEQFWEFLERCLSPKHVLYCFAHSAGFDLTILDVWARLESGWLTLADTAWKAKLLRGDGETKRKPWSGLLVAEGPPTILIARHGTCTVKFVDTLNYFRMSLKKLGKSIGLPKLNMPERGASTEDWFTYCARDVEIIELAMTQLINFWRENRLGAWRYTAPGLAWNAYRHQFMPGNPCDNPPEPGKPKWFPRPGSIMIHGKKVLLGEEGLERRAYYGGRVQSFFVGPVVWGYKDGTETVPADEWERGAFEFGPIFSLDANSMYPHVMRAGVYPYRLKRIIPAGGWESWSADLPPGECIAEVSLNTRVVVYPYRLDGRTRYVTGRFNTALAGPELEQAVTLGHVVGVGMVAQYQVTDLFGRYVDYFSALRNRCRAEGNEAWADLAKMLLNSLAGKFGQWSGRWQDDQEEPVIKPWGSWFKTAPATEVPQHWRAVGANSQRYCRGQEAYDSFPAVGAFVTSYARVYMREAMRVAGYRNVFYTDTDSLHVTQEGYNNLDTKGWLDPIRLGAFKLTKTVKTGEYWGLKHYRLGDELVIGAIPRDIRAVGENHYKHLIFQSLSSILQTRPRGEVQVREVEKELSLCHPDGTRGADGWVTPLSIE